MPWVVFFFPSFPLGNASPSPIYRFFGTRLIMGGGGLYQWMDGASTQSLLVPGTVYCRTVVWISNNGKKEKKIKRFQGIHPIGSRSKNVRKHLVKCHDNHPSPSPSPPLLLPCPRPSLTRFVGRERGKGRRQRCRRRHRFAYVTQRDPADDGRTMEEQTPAVPRHGEGGWG